MVGKSTCGSAETGSLERMPASAIPIVSNVVATGRPMNGADSFIEVLHHPPSEVTILCQPIEIQGRTAIPILVLNTTTCATPSSGIADLIATDRYQPAVARQRGGRRAFGKWKKT